MVFAVGDMIDFEAVAREVAGQESEQGEKHTDISFRGSNAEPRSGDVGIIEELLFLQLTLLYK